MIFEHRRQPLAPPGEFRRRMLGSLALASGVLGLSLAAGIAGYHWCGGLPWLDALVNASMILGGMGPVDAMTTFAGKFFSALFALYCGVVFLIVAGILVAPVFHRMLHRFHLERESRKS